MRIFGLPIPFTGERQKALTSVSSSRGWYPIRESFSGAWQTNVVVDREAVLAFHAVYACTTLIASDIAKLRMKLVQQEASGIWSETTSPAFTPVLRKPNHYQTRIQFYETWVLSKLSRGNAYVLKERDARGVVTALYVLDPNRVTPKIADNGDVYYDLAMDYLSGLPQQVIVPARDIIHDRFNCLYHPMVGVSPIFASGLAATQGVRIQNSSATFFGNGARPSGILTAPGEIGQETAERLKEYWETEFVGSNTGKIAVLGDDLKYAPMTMTSVDAQLIEQLKWTAEVVCSTFHVPPYKIGIGQMPTYNNIQALNIEYYTQALQRLMEDIELCLDEGLGLDAVKDGRQLGTEFDLDGLLRMDSVAQMEVLDKGRDFMTVDEARRRIDLPPTPGGNAVYRQQQDFSLAALAKRDATDDPFGTEKPEPAAAPPAEDMPPDAKAAVAGALLRKKMLAA